ncbi:MAG: hypothetical protein HY081_01985 [Gammaproteobacteria bacterium]|nr:hypothetical protein [Gammaproteobacteria bacterium]
MVENRKQLVSVRLCHADIERIRAIAARLRVRESDVIRFALRLAFSKLAPLLDVDARGADLIPIFLECGPELTYHFDLDARTLDSILNEGIGDSQTKIDSGDIELIAALHLPSFHTHAKIKALPKLEIGRLSLSGALQQYLYDKYIHSENDTDDQKSDSRPITHSQRDQHALMNAAVID